MILPILSYGAKVLRKECEDFDENTPLENLISDMYDTMYAASGVGLAGPQIGIGKRIFIVDGSPFAESDDGEQIDDELLALKGFKKVFINPIIEEESGDLWPFAEGCLCIPGIREDVERKSNIKISYFNENWQYMKESYQGISARIIQHEYDHIEGILFTDHLKPLKKRLLKGKLDDISKGKVEVNYKMKFQNLKR